MNTTGAHTNDTDAWNAYWRDGRGAACRSDDEGMYRGVIGEYWRQSFQLLTADARVLDLATGNGAVLQLAAETGRARNTGWQLYGVDQACIAPEWLQQQNVLRPHLLAGISNEALPFARQMFDLVCSQYGAEYGDLKATLQECQRVLKPGGQLRWVCHWRDGSVVRGAERELAGLALILKLGLPQKMLALIEQQLVNDQFMPGSHQRTANSIEAQHLRDGLNQAFTYLQQGGYSAESGLNVFLHNLAHLYQYRESQPAVVVRRAISDCGKQLEHHYQRLAALIRSAWSPQYLDTILAEFENHGFRLFEHGPLSERGGPVVAYALHAEKCMRCRS